MIAIDLSKQQVRDADQKKIIIKKERKKKKKRKKTRKFNFSANEAREVNADTIMFFISEEAKETILDLSKRIVGVRKFVFALIQSQYNTLNVKLSNSQLNNLELEIKDGIGITLNLSSNVVRGSYDETNFAHKLLLINTQVSSIRKALVNGSSANIKFSKTPLSRLLEPLAKTGLPLIRDKYFL